MDAGNGDMKSLEGCPQGQLEAGQRAEDHGELVERLEVVYLDIYTPLSMKDHSITSDAFRLCQA